MLIKCKIFSRCITLISEPFQLSNSVLGASWTWLRCNTVVEWIKRTKAGLVLGVEGGVIYTPVTRSSLLERRGEREGSGKSYKIVWRGPGRRPWITWMLRKFRSACISKCNGDIMDMFRFIGFISFCTYVWNAATDQTKKYYLSDWFITLGFRVYIHVHTHLIKLRNNNSNLINRYVKV